MENTDTTSATQATATGTTGDGCPVRLTSKAIEAVKSAMAEEKLENHGLRIAVQGGGCSGLQYALDFSDEERMGDSVFDVGGLKLYIDMASAQYLKDTEIDYVSGLNGTGFKFNNPNAKRTCGCGSSFS
ncbi:MAG: iron-sulfur cluster assembly accessory protein [Deltaproteobacteria bacterium]|nr:iron-sulfur cluster assembly accessory protein [Deltaproteobacteria bacterium]